MSGVILGISHKVRKLKISGNTHQYQWILLLKFEPDPIKFNSILVSLFEEGPILSYLGNADDVSIRAAVRFFEDKLVLE